MPATENIKRWIEQSTIDYTTYFIKAWIPFNAWYNDHFNGAGMDSDRAKINAAKNTPNPARNGINDYLEGVGQPSDEFRNYLAGLHFALQQTQMTGNDGRISFHDIVKEKNTTNVVNNQSIQSTTYFLKRTDGPRLGEVAQMQLVVKDKNNHAVLTYQHNGYDLADLQAKGSFLALSPTRRENARLLFERLSPVVTIDAIETTPTENPKNYYRCDSYNFKRDISNPNCYGHIVCRGAIEVLYQLRNQLFHGEILPNDTIQPAYQTAYFLLKMILEKVK